MVRAATTNMSTSTPARMRNGTPRLVSCATTPPSTDPPSIATLPTIRARPNTVSRLPRYSVARERVDEPRVHGTREEREPEPEQHRHDRPRPERRLPHPEQAVDHRGHGERDGAEQVRGTPPERVGDDARRDLEEEHAGAEERVRGERLEVREARVEQEQRVDAPDERGGERVAERERVVDGLHTPGVGIRRPAAFTMHSDVASPDHPAPCGRPAKGAGGERMRPARPARASR